MFIKPNKTKAKLKAGQSAFGVIATTDDPQLAELFGIAGFDYYMLDAEHGLHQPDFSLREVMDLGAVPAAVVLDLSDQVQ